MARLVMKFGGTSVADIDRIRNVARHVKRAVAAGHEVAVVVSAMAGATNRLVDWCREAALLHDAREYDAGGGDRRAGDRRPPRHHCSRPWASMPASWRAGWQLPIRTSDAHGSARILEVNGSELIKPPSSEARRGRRHRRFPGRACAGAAASPRSAGAAPTPRRGIRGRGLPSGPIAATSIADVDGVYTTDPRVVSKARRLDKIAYEEMLELASLGAKVLQVRSVELGMVHTCASSCARAFR